MRPNRPRNTWRRNSNSPSSTPHLLSPLQGTKILKQSHAKLLRNGGAGDTLAVGKLLADAVAQGPTQLPYARSIFASIKSPLNTFIWNCMIRGLAHGPSPEEALSLYKQMLAQSFSPNNFTYPFLLTASSNMGDSEFLGFSLHGSLIRRGFEDSDEFIQTGLINFYAKFRFLDVARKLFDRCFRRDVALWNALIKGYIDCGRYWEAVEIFRKMDDGNYDEITMISVLSACAHLGALDLGRWIHSYIRKSKMRTNLNLGSALVNMYCRCGQIGEAYYLFDEMPQRDVRAWSIMLRGLAVHGHAREALRLFEKMKAVGVVPDSVTLTGVLSACSHSGLVEEGLEILDTMAANYGISPTIEHYGCAVDLLGRAGKIEEALELIKKVPLDLDVALWGALLVACRVNRNFQIGEMAAREMLLLDPGNAGALVFLSNAYAATGRWDKVEKTRETMKEMKIKKPPGSSSIEFGGIVHEFISGDATHPEMNEIYAMVDEIRKLKGASKGSIGTTGVSFYMEEEDEEQCVAQHSEKLALAFGLLKTRAGTTLRIIKNLRICGDCHVVMKMVSKAFSREVIVRDRARFHHFKDGFCSCKDYW